MRDLLLEQSGRLLPKQSEAIVQSMPGPTTTSTIGRQTFRSHHFIVLYDTYRTGSRGSDCRVADCSDVLANHQKY